MDRDIEGCVIIATILFLFVAMGLVIAEPYVNPITEDGAAKRFSELSQAPISEIKVIRHSDNTPYIGDTHDVTFELLISGKPTSGHCLSAFFRPMVCRLYGE